MGMEFFEFDFKPFVADGYRGTSKQNQTYVTKSCLQHSVPDLLYD